MSLTALKSQGFEDGPARRALRLHQNDTQVNGDVARNNITHTQEPSTPTCHLSSLPNDLGKVGRRQQTT
eukprot:3717127-Amphidinium_carterae.1